MQAWERARVLALGADDASRRAALPLLSASSWPESGCTTDQPPVLWGRCRGSATYSVAVRPGAAYRCSCPSRKSPCKHALALMLRWAAGDLGPGEAPSYAVLAAEAPAAPASERVPDAEAAAQRAAARADRVAAGMEELDRWLGDQVRAGLAGLERAGWSHFDTIAARMVDAQAPGVAGLLRGLPVLLAQDGWPEQVLDALAGLHLLVRAHRGLDRLPDDLAATVRSRVGYPVPKAAVLAGPAVVDHWFALGAVDVLEGRLESRRVWLWGSTTRRWALLLSFAVPGAGLDDSVAVGQVLHAALHFYPGAAEHRGLVGEQWPPHAGVEVAPDEPASARERWAAQVAADPWATRMPVLLRAVPVAPAAPRQPWRLRGDDGFAVPVTGLPADPWALLALAADGPVQVFGEWGRSGFRPLRVVTDPVGSDEPRLLAVG